MRPWETLHLQYKKHYRGEENGNESEPEPEPEPKPPELNADNPPTIKSVLMSIEKRTYQNNNDIATNKNDIEALSARLEALEQYFPKVPMQRKRGKFQ